MAALIPEIEKQTENFRKNAVLERLNQRDVTLWSKNVDEQLEISQRLGWLDAGIKSESLIAAGEELLTELLREGYTHALVLGMGGSSLAPEVYSQFADRYNLNSPRSLSVSILDSTSPEQILRKQAEIPLNRTIFIVSSKSGTTVEVNTLFAYFWEQVEKVNPKNAGRHFIAIGDSGTKIQNLAAEKNFRRVIEADPNVGGRYSALIAFGLIPAILAGFDGRELLEKSSAKSAEGISIEDRGVHLGLAMGAACLTGRDKLTILSDPQPASLGSWIEQLVAESSGKDGQGIIPIHQEPVFSADHYQADRFFVHLRKEGALDEFVGQLTAAGHPVYVCDIPGIYDLAAEFYRWEIAVAVACIILNVNAFNQPNVQESKDIAKQMIAALKSKEDLKIDRPLWSDQHLTLYGAGDPKPTLRETLGKFLSLGKGGDFIAINAFVARNEENENSLQSLRKFLTEQTGLPTTLGFGPRFLHSTGQLHKGGKNNGLFIVISQDEPERLSIPGEGITFNDLIMAQALGDCQALEKHDRRVIRLHFADWKLLNSDLPELFR
jgi:transaldolase/glucose-6-phosphate isomerase